VLGIDGMDPRFVEDHLAELPNLRELMKQGEFKRLQTTMPPQSPVAWSTFSTGLDPIKNGIFDFVYRDPGTMTPFSAMGEMEAPAHKLLFGPYQLPLGSPHERTFRQGEVFWKLLADCGVPVKILRMPVNYPPQNARGESLSGMGVPDMRGTFGTFTYFTDNPGETRRSVSGGEIVPVQIMNDEAILRVEGPVNPLRRDQSSVGVSLTVSVDPFQNVARFLVEDRYFILKGGEWSDWIPVSFPIVPGIRYAHGMIRVYAKGFRPDFQVYVSPVNFNPLQPDADMSAPRSYSADLASKIGLYYTQGMAEDTSAYRHGVFDRQDYLTQSREVGDEQRHMLEQGLAGFKQGFFFIHLSSVDQNSHMLWKKFEGELLETYQRADDEVGWVMKNYSDATIIVMSDHGFTSFDRAVNLNAWLLQQGLDKTAYALGLNAMYLRLQGRERDGTVPMAGAADTLKRLGDRLLSLKDPINGARVIARIWSPHPEFQGNIRLIPDLIVGFAAGYRESWEGSLGDSSGSVLKDNIDAWIGDHCMAPEFVPGVLISNRRSNDGKPSLKDLTASILSLYGIPREAGMDGKVIY
jgi:predicted AlkP superfamily phosphohydrolase/phosphomutase